MAFGLPQWLMSLATFLFILTIIIWSMIYLGRKNQNATDVYDMDDYPTDWKEKMLHSTTMDNLTSQGVESTDDSMLFMTDQGSEIPDSVQFYEIVRIFYSTESSAVNSTNYDIVTTTFAFSASGNDSIWNNDTTIMLYNTSDKTFILDNHQNISKNITIL